MSKASSEQSQMVGDGDHTTNLSHTFKYLLDVFVFGRIATQFLSRGIPFIFNSWIVRHLTEEDYALYAVQFHLFVTCVLFLSREGFRRACLRVDIRCDGASTGENAAKLLKVAWMILPLGIVITITACVLVFWWQALSYSSPYAQAILINGFACILELLAEPLYILSQNLLLLKLRLMVETAATLLHCVTTYILIVKQTDMVKGIVFAISQTAYGALFFFGYWGYFLLFLIFRTSDLFPFSCLPSGWTVLLISGVTTLISEKIFLDPDNFWPTFFIHFSIGLTCFCIASFIIYRCERPFINQNYTFP